MADPIERLARAVQATAKNYPGGMQALGKAIGVKNTGTFMNKCNPSGEHKITLNEAVAILAETNDFSLLDVLGQELDYLLVSMATPEAMSDKEVLKCWTEWDIEFGQLADVMRNALQDKKITKSEYHRIRTELFEEFTRELRLLRLVESHLVGAKNCRILESIRRTVGSSSLDDAIHNTVLSANGGFDAVAGMLDLTPGILRRKLDPLDKNMRFNLYETYHLMVSVNDHRILYHIADRFDFACIPMPRAVAVDSEMEILNAWSARSRERGDIARVLDEVLNTDRPMQSHVLRVCEEMFEDLKSGFAMMKRIASFSGAG